MRELRIVFFGTPEFAVPSLKVLVEAGYKVVGVVTAPDRPKGRGKVLQESEIKKYALSKGLHILQPEKLKSPEFNETLASLSPNLFVVVAFRMLPELVWKMPEYGTFNLHASLLPNYRGAAPINWAIINGENETGVTTFFLKHEIDTGNIILQEKEPIYEDDDAGTLYVRLMNKGSKLVKRTVDLIRDGEPETSEQSASQIKHAPKIYRETCEIYWDRSSVELRNFIRGLSPYPGAWTHLNGKFFKILDARIAAKNLSAGEIRIEVDKVYIGTADGSIEILQLQAEGKRRMKTEDYLKGNTI